MQYWGFFKSWRQRRRVAKSLATGLSPTMLEAWKGSGSCLGPLSLILQCKLQCSFNTTITELSNHSPFLQMRSKQVNADSLCIALYF